MTVYIIIATVSLRIVMMDLFTYLLSHNSCLCMLTGIVMIQKRVEARMYSSMLRIWEIPHCVYGKLPYSGFYWRILNVVIWRIGLESPILNLPLIIA